MKYKFIEVKRQYLIRDKKGIGEAIIKQDSKGDWLLYVSEGSERFLGKGKLLKEIAEFLIDLNYTGKEI